jgi:hypothetical protein
MRCWLKILRRIEGKIQDLGPTLFAQANLTIRMTHVICFLANTYLKHATTEKYTAFPKTSNRGDNPTNKAKIKTPIPKHKP